MVMGLLRSVCQSFNIFLLAALFSASWVGSELNASAFSIAPEKVRIGDCYTLQVENGAGITLDLRYRHNQGPVQTVQGWPTLDDAGTSRVCTSAETPLGHYEFTGYKNTLSRDWIPISESLEIVPAPEDIDLTVVGQGISVTSENQIVVELMPEDIVPASPLDLAGRTLVFTPDGRGGYARSVGPVAWEQEIGVVVEDRAEIAFRDFRFPFAGEQWESFFVSRNGLVTFGEPWPHVGPLDGGSARWSPMTEIAARYLVGLPTVSALYKPNLGGDWRNAAGNVQHLARWSDRLVVTWITSDPQSHLFGRPPNERTRFQAVLHADGRIAFHYAAAPRNPDEAIRDGIVGLFPNDPPAKGDLVARIVDPTQPMVPGPVDLLEVTIHTSNTADLIVEFTTRDPIRPKEDARLSYFLLFDEEAPWWTERDRSDGDSYLYVVLEADGTIRAGGPGVRGPYQTAAGNRIGLLVSGSEFSGRPVSAIAQAAEFNVASDTWQRGNGWSSPVLVEFPDAPAPIDLSEPDRQHSRTQMEVFHYSRIRDMGGLVCRMIEVLGDEFDVFFSHSQFRHDPQGGNWRSYGGAVFVEGIGSPRYGNWWFPPPPCETKRLRGHFRIASWIKTIAKESPDLGRTHFSHEFAHSWVARASYLANGEDELLTDGSHWLHQLHAPAPFPWRGAENGSIMGGNFWRENGDGTFTPTSGWGSRAGGYSWLDLYFMGLARADEVPDMFLLRNLEPVRENVWRGDKEIVTISQVIDAVGPRDPPASRSQKVFNAGFLYLLEPGQAPDPESVRMQAEWRDRALEHYRHITGGRSRLTTELPRP